MAADALAVGADALAELTLVPTGLRVGPATGGLVPKATGHRKGHARRGATPDRQPAGDLRRPLGAEAAQA